MPIADQGVSSDRYQLIPRTLIFLTRGESVLLLKGAPNKRIWANRYNGVGGHIERGEDAHTAARRELLEFMHAELGGDPAFRDGMPSFQTVIRFLEGHRTDRRHPALASVRRAYEQAGLPHREKGIPFATDAFAFRKVSKTDVAVIGPCGKNPHGVDEYVDIESVLSLIRIMVLTALDYCG